MAVHALADALKDFGARPRVVESFATPPGLAEAAELDLAPPLFPEVPAMELPDTGALVADAVAEAETVLAQRLEQEHADALQAERERQAEEIAEIQKQFAEEAGERILAGIDEMESRLLELTSTVTARILGAVLADSVRERSLERLAGVIREALGDEEAVRIRVRGSLPLYEALKEKLPRYADQIDFAEGTGFDLSVAIDDSIFETRLAEWSSALAEALS